MIFLIISLSGVGGVVGGGLDVFSIFQKLVDTGIINKQQRDLASAATVSPASSAPPADAPVAAAVPPSAHSSSSVSATLMALASGQHSSDTHNQTKEGW